MDATKRKILFVGGLSAILMVLVIHFLRAEEYPASSLPLRVDSSPPTVAKQARTNGLQWMDALPVSAADKQERPPTFGEEVAALTATRNPKDALVAYGIIEGCEGLRSLFEMDAMPPAFLPRKKQCATITDAMRKSTHDYLRAAASADSPGVGSPWFRYGPSGDKEALRSRPNDPSVIEWKRNAFSLLIRDGEQGDINALQDLMNGYAGKSPGFDADPRRALAYAMAYRDILNTMDTGPVSNKPTDAELDALAGGLSPEQVAWAKVKAKGIIEARGKSSTSGSR